MGRMELVRGRHPRKSKAQFWACTAMSCLLFLQWAWVFYTAQILGPQSPAGQLWGPLTLVLWLSIPTFAYYAWQGYRQSVPIAGSATIGPRQ
jgi:hypothetical protein